MTDNNTANPLHSPASNELQRHYALELHHDVGKVAVHES